MAAVLRTLVSTTRRMANTALRTIDEAIRRQLTRPALATPDGVCSVMPTLARARLQQCLHQEVRGSHVVPISPELGRWTLSLTQRRRERPYRPTRLRLGSEKVRKMSSAICPHCGFRDLPVPARYCNHCGRKLADAGARTFESLIEDHRLSSESFATDLARRKQECQKALDLVVRRLHVEGEPFLERFVFLRAGKPGLRTRRAPREHEARGWLIDTYWLTPEGNWFRAGHDSRFATPVTTHTLCDYPGAVMSALAHWIVRLDGR